MPLKGNSPLPICEEDVFEFERERDRSDFFVGLSTAVVGHLILTILFFAQITFNFGADKPVIYSITLEGGKSLGGLSQVPKKDKSEVAPPKNIEPKKEEKPIEKVEEKVVVKEKVKEEPKKEEKKVEKIVKKEEKKKEPTKEEIDKKLQQAVQRYLGESTDAGGKGFGAGALGGVGMGGGTLVPKEFFEYQDRLKTHVKSGWRWYDTAASIMAKVAFEIAPDGAVSNVRIVQSSGNAEFDDSALRAVYKANPVPPPPEIVYDKFRDVIIKFDPRE